jgi:hypothetical protein
MQAMSTGFEEVKDALVGDIDQMRRTAKELRKASEDVSHDVCVTMQNMASSLEKTTGTLYEIYSGQPSTPTDYSDYPSNFLEGSDDSDDGSDDRPDPRFDDPYYLDTDDEC